jgi:hypothetical protein
VLPDPSCVTAAGDSGGFAFLAGVVFTFLLVLVFGSLGDGRRK